MSGALGDNARAAGLLLLTVLLYGLNDMLVKLALVEIGVGQVLALRGAMICPLLLVWLAWRRRLWTLRPALGGVSLLRGLCEVVVSLSFFAGLSRLPLADATVLLFTAPLMITLIAAFFLREPVDARRWLAVVVGFIGVVVAAGPGGGIDSALMFPLLAAVFVALRDVITRYVDPGLDNVAVAFVTALVVTIGGAGTAVLGWRPLDPALLPFLGASALCIALAYVTLVAAYRLGEASYLAPIRYVSIPFAAFLGFLAFGDQPGLNVLIGALVIVAAGLMMLRRNPPADRAPRLGRTPR